MLISGIIRIKFVPPRGTPRFEFFHQARAAPRSPDTTSVASFTSTAIDSDFVLGADSSTSNSFLSWTGTASLTPTGQPIHLGSFDLTANNLGVAVYSFADSEPGTGIFNQTWSSGTTAELDQIIFGAGAAGTYQFTFTAIPEPSSLFGFGLFVLAMTSRRRL